MNNENEIERMAKTLCADYPQGCKNCPCSPYTEREDGEYCSIEENVETLYNAGIGDKKQAVKNAFEEVKSLISRQHYYVTRKDIDKLYTKLYGEDR